MSAHILPYKNYDFLLSLLLDSRESILTTDRHYVRSYGANADRDNKEALTMIGNILAKANYDSVNYRYGENGWAHEYTFTYKYDQIINPVVAALKVLDCYEYQACEPKNYNESEAAKICARMRKIFISKLDGYSDAPWGLN